MNEKTYWYFAHKSKAIHDKTGMEPDIILQYVVAAWLFPHEDLCFIHNLTGIPCRTLKKVKKADHLICRVI